MEIKNINTYAELQTALQDKKVTGYIWMVSHKKPCIYQNKEIDFTKLKYSSPVFNKIQEAYLYIDNYSIHIKNIDGEELFFILNENNFNNENFEISKEIYFPSHKITDKQLIFKKVYKLTDSVSGKDFKTMQPVARLFKGFKKVQAIKK